MGRGTYIGGGTIERINSINSQSLASKNLSFYRYYNYNYDQDKYKNISKELLLYILNVNYDILGLINKLKFTSNFKVIYQSDNHCTKIKNQFELLKKIN